jgi:hypothetical protein
MFGGAGVCYAFAEVRSANGASHLATHSVDARHRESSDIMANETDAMPATDDLAVDQLDTVAGGTGHGPVEDVLSLAGDHAK